VVDLPHQQPTADVERQMQGGGVGLGHHHATKWRVASLVGHLTHARDVPEGKEDAAEQEHDEAPQRDLAEHERPVVGEDLADVLLDQRSESEPLVEPVDRTGHRSLEAVELSGTRGGIGG
jgi:hypothetical protein